MAHARRLDARGRRQGIGPDLQLCRFQRGVRLPDASRAAGSEKIDHHPEFTNVWNRVDFRLTSHDSGGVTDRDIMLAEAINRLGG